MELIPAYAQLAERLAALHGHTPVLPACALTRDMKKELVNSWSAEYALRITPVVNDQYLQSSLHWTFPQTYYSFLFMARAALRCCGIEKQAEHDVARHVYTILRQHPATGFRLTGAGTFLDAQHLTWSDRPLSDTLGIIHRNRLDRDRLTYMEQHKGNMPTSFQLKRKTGNTNLAHLLGKLRISSSNDALILGQEPALVVHNNLVTVATSLNQWMARGIAAAVGQPLSGLWQQAPQYIQDMLTTQQQCYERA